MIFRTLNKTTVACGRAIHCNLLQRFFITIPNGVLGKCYWLALSEIYLIIVHDVDGLHYPSSKLTKPGYPIAVSYHLIN